MELKSPKTKKKSVEKVMSWKKMIRAPLIMLLLLGTSTCDSDSDIDVDIPISNSTYSHQVKWRHRPELRQPHNSSVYLNKKDRQILSDIKFLRRHLNKEILNFVMTDVLMDGEVENRIHYNGITAKETSVSADG